MKVVLRNFRIVDETNDFFGSIFIENGVIREVVNGNDNFSGADIVINGEKFGASAVLMPAFIDLHAHFREPGFPEKETLESASLAAAAGGFTTVVCMANTNPVIDTIEKAAALKTRSDNLGLVDLYPVLSLTKNMEGLEISGIKELSSKCKTFELPIMLSEDGKDVEDEDLFLAAMIEAKRLGIPVSCHCDLGGKESSAVSRAVELGKKAKCHIHIAHVSTAESIEIIREEKINLPTGNGFNLSCEVTPHHIGVTEEDARLMGEKSFGRVNPPLSSESDRQIIISAVKDGTIDVIATDHAPHSESDKANGAPGFSGLETAFAASITNLFPPLSPSPSVTSVSSVVKNIELCRLSALMSSNPARIIGLNDRGRIKVGLRADIAIVDTQAEWKVKPENFKSKGKCCPFKDKVLKGKIIMTFNAGKIVFDGGLYV